MIRGGVLFDLITIGDCTIDNFLMLDDKEIGLSCDRTNDHCKLCLTFADKIPVKETYQLVAGNASNNAVGASRLGLRTALYTVIGDDSSGERIRHELEQEAIATDYVLTEVGTASNFHTVLAFHGERTILIHHVPRQYHLPRMQATKWVYLTSMADGFADIFPALEDYLVQHQTKLIYQPGTFQLRAGRKGAKNLLQQTEVLIMNKEEAQNYLAVQSDNVRELLDGLIHLGPKKAVITDGLKGSYASEGNRYWFLGTRPDIPRIESTGAGDAYASGFGTAIILGRPIPEAMQWGTLNAEGVIQQIGPHAGLQTRGQIEHALVHLKGLEPVTLS